jgi:hypothetical protein
MGDYLGNLVLRSVAPPRIRPRTRSLFEPLKGALETAVFGFEKQTVFEKISRDETMPTPAPAQRTAPVETRLAEARDVKEAREVHRTVEVAGRVAARLDDATAPIPSQPALLERRVQEPAATSVEGRPARKMEQSVPVVERPRRVTGAAEAERPIQAEKKSASASNPVVTRPLKAPVETGHSATPVRETRVEPRQTGIQRATPTLTAEFTAPIHAEAAAARPDVHISIGRVIVNSAPTPARAAAAPPSHRPKVSLEQYLQRRGGVA